MGAVLHEGARYPVTEAWHVANTVPWPELAGMEASQLERERWALLGTSDERGLTDAETARLEAVTRHCNVRRALIFLGGRPHTDFGFEGVDQVHGNRHTLACGCSLHLVFDHHKAMAGEPLEHHPHAPHRLCAKHRPALERGLPQLHALVLRDNQQEA